MKPFRSYANIYAREPGTRGMERWEGRGRNRKPQKAVKKKTEKCRIILWISWSADCGIDWYLLHVTGSSGGTSLRANNRLLRDSSWVLKSAAHIALNENPRTKFSSNLLHRFFCRFVAIPTKSHALQFVYNLCHLFVFNPRNCETGQVAKYKKQHSLHGEDVPENTRISPGRSFRCQTRS